VSQVYQLTPTNLAAAALASTIIVWILYPVTSMMALLSWYAGLNAINLGRYLLILAYRRANPDTAHARIWATRFTVSTLLVGIVWGLPGSLLYPPRPVSTQ